MARRFVPTALLLGNFVVGTSVIAPAAMLPELSRSFSISVREASLLITFGAIVMCLGAPLISWWTSRMDRRLLLGGSLLLIALTHLLSVFVSSYAALFALRLLMVAAAAPFTPQAAGVVSLLTPEARRPAEIAYVFLGWSLSTAAGVPMVTTLASRYGWAVAYGAIALFAALAFVLVITRLPSQLRTTTVELATWVELRKNHLVMRLLLLTVLLTAGQFVVLTFAGPLSLKVIDASPSVIALIFACFGVAGLIGNLIATRVVAAWGAYRTALVATSATALGLLGWSLGLGTLSWMALSIAVWGLGFASTNSMQQARLVAAAPAFAGASVALNTSSIYVGQAVGSALGGMLFARGATFALGYTALTFVLLGLAVLLSTRPSLSPSVGGELSDPRQRERA
jgi:MFS transporter, DHA1 family, inner membrane transport protein